MAFSVGGRGVQLMAEERKKQWPTNQARDRLVTHPDLEKRFRLEDLWQRQQQQQQEDTRRAQAQYREERNYKNSFARLLELEEE